jgi:hypothetical protein
LDSRRKNRFRIADGVSPGAGAAGRRSTAADVSVGNTSAFHPGGQYIIRKKGVLEVESNACADCHTRVMPDKSFFQGGQGITERPTGEERLRAIRESSPASIATQVERDWVLFGAPWILSKDSSNP